MPIAGSSHIAHEGRGDLPPASRSSKVTEAAAAEQKRSSQVDLDSSKVQAEDVETESGKEDVAQVQGHKGVTAFSFVICQGSLSLCWAQ